MTPPNQQNENLPEVDANPGNPQINIEHVQNFFASDFDIQDHFSMGNSRFSIPRSKAKAIKRKLKKIIKQANQAYDRMVTDDFALNDVFYDQQM